MLKGEKFDAFTLVFPYKYNVSLWWSKRFI